MDVQEIKSACSGDATSHYWTLSARDIARRKHFFLEREDLNYKISVSLPVIGWQ